MYKNFKIVVSLFFLISGVIFFGFLALDKYLFSSDKIENSFVPPAIIQAVYLTNYSAANPKKIEEIIELSKNSEINAVVIDIKDWSGYISYDTKILQADYYKSKRVLISDVKKLVDFFHAHGIYTVARIVVFQDPVLAKAKPELAIRRGSLNGPLWLDNLGLAWIDPTYAETWDYNIALAQDAIAHGFDEVNFDYVRFASDGNLSSMVYPNWDKSVSRSQVIKKFFEYVRKKMKDDIISIDLFGYTTVHEDDLGIGQIIEDAFPNFNFICPMTYPSLYNKGFIGFSDPSTQPYAVVKYSMETGLDRLTTYNQQLMTTNSSKTASRQLSVKFRPWVQNFKGYDKIMIGEQIRAIKDALGDQYVGYIVWSPTNNYLNLVSNNQ